MYFDRLRLSDGTEVMVKVHSMVGIIPYLGLRYRGSDPPGPSRRPRLRTLRPTIGTSIPMPWPRTGLLRGEPGHQQLLLGMVVSDRILHLVTRLLDEREFLSPHGLRALSAYHRENPYVLEVEDVNATIDYEPAESTTAMFGGNSNWRGPVWYPLHYLACSALERYGTLPRR